MGGGVVAYIETEPEIEIRAGMVYFTSPECGGSGRFVMSVHTFKKVIRRANRELARWDAGERTVLEFTRHAASP